MTNVHPPIFHYLLGNKLYIMFGQSEHSTTDFTLFLVNVKYIDLLNKNRDVFHLTSVSSLITRPTRGVRRWDALTCLATMTTIIVHTQWMDQFKATCCPCSSKRSIISLASFNLRTYWFQPLLRTIAFKINEEIFPGLLPNVYLYTSILKSSLTKTFGKHTSWGLEDRVSK